ncbi:hypothetical protein J2Y69_001391 [Microbacterium resistens]|uniref:DUF4145 domain-containing protein n=1 Tax=Microbacterium resistens TaxID=156977 RepID=A0ABU1SB07_9MICO|nr:DUF4145 domain-containing protein [Microbacterium resistens]MDR6866792.1 hypothetical protein [Microbacterium resistens]
MASHRDDELERPDAFSLKDCPHCGRHAHQVLTTPRIIIEDSDTEESEVYLIDDQAGAFEPSGAKVVPADWRYNAEVQKMWKPYVPGARWQATLCAACKSLSLWREGVLIFPATIAGGPSPHPDMPEATVALYREAAAVLAGSKRAAAALARAAVESLLLETDTSGQHRDLNTRVGELRGTINDDLWKVLTALRVVGNDALHGGDGELIAVYLQDSEGELAETFLGAINALVEELITRPRRASTLYDMLPAAKREAAERAATQAESRRTSAGEASA